MRNKSKAFVLIILLFKISLFSSFGQATELRGAVIDEKNGIPLSDVRLFVNNDIRERTNAQGKFHISVEDSNKVRFWKSGYVFQTFRLNEIRNKGYVKIKLSKSSPAKNNGNDIKLQAVTLDGVALQEKDWYDINPQEVKDANVEFVKGGIKITYITKK